MDGPDAASVEDPSTGARGSKRPHGSRDEDIGLREGVYVRHPLLTTGTSLDRRS